MSTITSLRARSKKLGVPFDLTEENFPLVPPNCPCCGLDFDLKVTARQQRPSLDRIVPEKGYVLGNVLWLCLRCDRIKGNSTPEELMKVALFAARAEARAANTIIIEVPEPKPPTKRIGEFKHAPPVQLRIWEALSDEWQTIKEIQDYFEPTMPRETVSLALNVFLREGKAMRRGSATRHVQWKKVRL